MWALLLAGGMAAAVVFYRQGWLTPALEVQTAVVQRIFPAQTFTLLNASGYVVADRKSAVASKLTGRIVYLGVEEGSRVRAGDIIARLESRDTAAARERAAQNVQVARHNLEQAQAELVNATLDYERKRSLVERGTIARAAFDTAEARFRTARAAVEALTAAGNAARAALQEAEVQLDYANIRAPFDAVVLTKNADVGDIVTPLAATADAKAAVVTIADMGSLDRRGRRVRVEHRQGAGRPALRDPPGRLPGRALPRPRAHDRAHGRPRQGLGHREGRASASSTRACCPR